MWWVFANYGRTEDMPLQGIFKVVADNAEQAKEEIVKFLRSEGYEFVFIKEVKE